MFAALDRWGVDPARLTLEITESNMVSESGGVAEVLKRLREVGVRLALDDFGTGYSSLTYLKHMPVSEVKVDRSFVTGMTEDPTNQTLVSSIVGLGQQLGLRVVGEGVEDEASLSALRTLGCDAAQGFQISKPLSCRRPVPLGGAAAPTGARPRLRDGASCSLARTGEIGSSGASSSSCTGLSPDPY